MLTLHDVMLYVGGKIILNEANMSINRGDKIGIFGRNGAGKSCLMSLLAGELAPDGGELTIEPNTSVLLVKQEDELDEQQTPLDFIKSRDIELKKVLEQIDKADGDELGELLNRQIEIEEERYEQLAPTVLKGLGLKENELTQPMRQLSGGLRQRIGLAMALIYRPSILLLDEPTNHLDLESTEWLLAYLKNYPSDRAFAIVTHDEKLLDMACDTTVNLRLGTVTKFGGRYHDYLEQVETSERNAVQANADREKEIARRTETYFKFRGIASRAAQAKGELKKAKELTRQMVVIPTEEPVVALSFGEPSLVQDPMIHIHEAVLGYDDKVVVSIRDLSIQFGDKIGIFGRNGGGKTTLLRFLAETHPPLAGDVVRKGNLKIGYFSQDLTEELNGDLTVYEQFAQKTRLSNDEQIKGILGHYGFPREKLETIVRHLSGGEKSRLLFAMICANSPNMIILDEPTNHLDVETREMLIKAINDYPGTVMLVTHDADLLQKTMNQFWLVHRETVTAYNKGFDHYYRALQQFVAKNIVDERAGYAAASSAKNGSSSASSRAASSSSSTMPSASAKKSEKTTQGGSIVARIGKFAPQSGHAKHGDTDEAAASRSQKRR